MRKTHFLAAAATTLAVALACSDVTPTTSPATKQLAPTGISRLSIPGAVFTSTNPLQDDPTVSPASMHDLCLNAKDSSPAIDCNIYRQKAYVWLTGGPGSPALDDGTYMFAVLAPGGQGGNEGPNDCTDNNLSDDPNTCPSDNTGAGDAWQNRVFTVSGGQIQYSGTHDFVNGKIRLMPYDNTPNNGDEYVMAVCQLPAVISDGANPPGVDPSDCKYDNFKVLEGCTVDCGGGGSAQGAAIVTELHLADHTVITETSALYLPAFGTLGVHDKAIVTTDGVDPAPMPVGSTVAFYFFAGTACSGTPFAGPENDDISGASGAIVHPALPQTISAPGLYSYKAYFYSGDLTLVTDAEALCEPFTVAAQLGKTMGFWGNTNGVYYITHNASLDIGTTGYLLNPVGIGRGSNIDLQAEAAKVFPNTLNACGKGNPLIYTGTGAPTANANCTLATGLNIGTFNTNAAQLLALNYNKKYVANFSGNTIGALGCSAYVTAAVTATGLTTTSNIQAVITAATGVVNTSAAGGTTTQGTMGALNSLIGCLNREA